MHKSLFNNIITATLITLFVFSPIVPAMEAKAQVGSYNAVGSFTFGSGGVQGGLDGYIKGLAPAITQLPGCRKKLSSWIKNIFQKIKGIKKDDLGSGVKDTVDDFDLEVEAILVKETEFVRKREQAKKDAQDENTKSNKNIEEQETCTNAIGKMIVDRLVQKITLSSVAWIQSGFHGEPAFVQQPGKFLRDIVKDELLKFKIELSGQGQFPFAKAFIKAQADFFNKKFTDNARYSLNELIKETTPQYNGYQFSADFSAGGWNAWTALTGVPANNPLGFTVISNEEIGKRTAGTSKSLAERLQEQIDASGGFLGEERCADPGKEDMTRAEDKAAHDAGQPGCLKWVYVTPGRWAAESLTNAVDYQNKGLLKVETLNDALAAIIDALIQRFSNDVYSKGLAAIPEDGVDGGIILSEYSVGGGYSTTTQVEKDYPDYLQGSNWFAEHPNFNIRTDLTQAIIDEQRTYKEKLEKQNETLARIILWTKQLDYCIAGPSLSSYQEVSQVDLFSNADDIEGKTSKPGVGEIILSTAFGVVGKFFSNRIAQKREEEEEHVRRKDIITQVARVFNVHLYSAWGYNLYEDSKDIYQELILDAGDRDGLAKSILASYKEVIHNTYFNGSRSLAPMPLVTAEARIEYGKIISYDNIIDQNEEDISLSRSVIQRLAKIKDTIEDMGPEPDQNTDPVGYEQYEAEIKGLASELGQLTEHMVTGNDVSRSHKLLKELEAKEVYIKNDLLIDGCEKEMVKLYDEDIETYSKFYRRQPYKEPILYLYGDNVGQNERSMTNNNIPASGNTPAHNSYDPHIHTLWSEYAVKNWNKYDGFLYGSVYWNFMTRPYDGGNRLLPDGKTHNPPNRSKIGEELAKTGCKEFIDIVYFSYPGIAGDTKEPIDIGGLEPLGGGFKEPYGPNSCGVINHLEDLASMY